MSVFLTFKRYRDGIDILYGTNTFHIASMSLLCNLPRRMSPNHLATITSLELLWTFNRKDCEDNLSALWNQSREPCSGVQHRIHYLCRMVPLAFPNVRRLYIALQADILPPPTFHSDDSVLDVERIILRPIEDMFSLLGHGKEFSIAIQRRVWEAFQDHLKEGDPRVLSIKGKVEDVPSYQDSVWKPLGDDGLGYWLRPGWDDSEVSRSSTTMDVQGVALAAFN